jgi:hypothetical protein
MAKFKTKNVMIDAYHVLDTVSDTHEVPKWLIDAIINGRVTLIDKDKKFSVKTLEGTMQGNVGDWIIRGIEGELYPCKHSIFIAKYEPA